MRTLRDFDEIKAAVGTEVGVSEWIEVTQKRIDQFARATGDDQWIHVDVTRAGRELPGGTTIAHGLLTLSSAPVFVRSFMGLEGVKNTINYGANRIRYLTPVLAGSQPLMARRATAYGSPMVLPLRSRTTIGRPAVPSSLPCITADRSRTAKRMSKVTKGVARNLWRLS